MNNHDMLLGINAINKSMLDIDSSGIISVQISNKFFKRRRRLKWVFSVFGKKDSPHLPFLVRVEFGHFGGPFFFAFLDFGNQSRL